MSARICPACGRPLDAKGHRVLRRGEPLKDRGRVTKRLMVMPRGRGRVGFQNARIYLCRVAPAYDSPTSGRTFRRAPYEQRIKVANIRHVQEELIDVG